ncbi:MAG: ATP-binding protein [Desulfohalobiaceae bacterium]
MLQAEFSANLAYVDQACSMAHDFLQRKGQGQLWFTVELGLREALNNAVVHGSRQDQNLQVSLQILILQDRIRITVQDQGAGFDWKQALQSKILTECEHGRGLCILRAYFHRLGFNQQGNRLDLELLLPQSNNT